MEMGSGEKMENFPASLRVIFLFYRLTPFPHSHPPLRVQESFVQTVSSQVGCASNRGGYGTRLVAGSLHALLPRALQARSSTQTFTPVGRPERSKRLFLLVAANCHTVPGALGSGGGN